VVIEEIKQDLEERALVKKQARQNKRQKRHRAKTVQKEIVEGIRDDDGRMKKKQKVSEISIQFSWHYC
jgi:hypothetical protein